MICIEFPTIMDGLVLRWYAVEGGPELASASRNRSVVEYGCPLEIRRLANEAHDYLHAAYARALHPKLDVSRWVTHTKSFGGKLTVVQAREGVK